MDREVFLRLRVGLFVLAGLILFMVFVLTIGSQSRLFEKSYTLHTTFASTEGVIVGAPIRLAGVSVGTVSSIGFGSDPRDRRIHLALAIQAQVRDRIREDSVASIGTIGLVGDKVLDITVGSPDRPVIPPGGVLRSVEPPDLSRLVRKGEQVLEQLNRSGTSLANFLESLGRTGFERDLAATLASLRQTAEAIKEGRGVLHTLIYDRRGEQILARALETAETVAATSQSLQRTARAVETGDGLLHALVYGDPGATLGRLQQALAGLEGIVHDIRQGDGTLHTLIYGPEGREIVTRLARAAANLDEFTRDLREGRGLLHALVFDPQGAQLVQNLRTLSAEIRDLAEKLNAGRGTLGALLDDPTLYEDLSSLLRGAERSVILRSLIRAGRRAGSAEDR